MIQKYSQVGVGLEVDDPGQLGTSLGRESVNLKSLSVSTSVLPDAKTSLTGAAET